MPSIANRKVSGERPSSKPNNETGFSLNPAQGTMYESTCYTPTAPRPGHRWHHTWRTLRDSAWHVPSFASESPTLSVSPISSACCHYTLDPEPALSALQVKQGETFHTDTDTEVIPKLCKWIYHHLPSPMPFSEVRTRCDEL